MPKRPFLLVSSNVPSANNNYAAQSLFGRLKVLNQAGYLDRDPEALKNEIRGPAEESRRLMSFVDAIKYLSNFDNGYDIVIRPHPYENIETWKMIFEGIPNVHVIRNDSITAWVNNAFAVMHNSCTTALEATISNKPVLTYAPFKMEYSRELANQLGYFIKSEEELLKKVNELFQSNKTGEEKNIIKNIPDIISKKFYIDDNELAAEKMIKVWESLDDNKLSRPINLTIYQGFLKIIQSKKIVIKLIKKLFKPSSFTEMEDLKFPPLDEKDICERANRLEKLLNIKKKLKYKFLSEKTILISQN